MKGEELGHLEEAWIRATAPLCHKKPVEVVRASDKHASRAHLSLQRLYISSGLGMPQNPPKAESIA